MADGSLSRRKMMIGSAAALVSAPLLAQAEQEVPARGAAAESGAHRPVYTPNGTTLPFKMVDGVKVFHLVAEPIKHEIAPGLVIDAWGYNGQTPGPTLEAVEGDRVRIYVTNRLPEPTSLHSHGILLPNGMDGVAGLNQKPIAPGETFKYEFTLRQNGTHMYHPHFDEMTQMAMGLMGMFVIHPRQPARPRPDRDFSLMLSEWSIRPGTSRPDPNEMTEFNVLTINSRAYPGTEPLVARQGDRVRIRIGNLSAMSHHSIHLHGYRFKVIETDGGAIPEAGQWPETTVLVPVGSTRTIEFIADAPGDWAMHCHMTHHGMNQMGHGVQSLLGIDAAGLDEKMRQVLPQYMTMGERGMGDHGAHMQHMPHPRNSIPMLGAQGPHGYIGMGGMFTVLKVRPTLAAGEDAGWYAAPAQTVASAASPQELARDGIGLAAKQGIKESAR